MARSLLLALGVIWFAVYAAAVTSTGREPIDRPTGLVLVFWLGLMIMFAAHLVVMLKRSRR